MGAGKRDPVLLHTEKHCCVVCDGVVYDNRHPEGIPGSEYPLRGDTVENAFAASRR
jgi:hypothetical protein